MKKNNKKGFTLAELLIVVAIIAVLVAISIPIFSAQLEKAREATDAANIRASYAEAMAAFLTDDSQNQAGSTVTIKQKDTSKWDISTDFPSNLTGTNGLTSGQKYTVTVSKGTNGAAPSIAVTQVS